VVGGEGTGGKSEWARTWSANFGMDFDNEELNFYRPLFHSQIARIIP
jgi:hypothetical protein